jgi:long-chain acyl-CoA synthetase
LLTNSKLIKVVNDDLNRLAAEYKLNSLEKIKQFTLIADPFTIESDVLTPSMKIKRNVAKKVFQKELDEMYSRPVQGA